MDRRKGPRGRRASDANGADPVTKRFLRGVVGGLAFVFTVGPGIEWLRGFENSDDCTWLLTSTVVVALVILYLVNIACDYQTRTYVERVAAQDRVIGRLQSVGLEQARRARKGAR